MVSHEGAWAAAKALLADAAITRLLAATNSFDRSSASRKTRTRHAELLGCRRTPAAYGGVILEQTINSTPRADALIGELAEPVRRYLQHAVPAGLPATSGVRLRMTGRIKLGLWLPFTAMQDCDGRSFEWRARVGRGRFTPLGVVDRYANGMGSVTGRLLGRYELFHQADEHVRRSAAGRAALEAILAPASLTPGRGVSWRAEDDEHIVASSYLEPDQVDVHMQIDSRGALRAFSAKRWGDTGQHSHGYLTFGGHVQAERRNVAGCEIHSADRVMPEFQDVAVGDEVRLAPQVGLVIALVEPGRSLVLRGGLPIGNTAPPYDFTWAFALRDEPAEATRLLVRERYEYMRPWARLLVEPVEAVSFAMSQKMLRGIKERAERTANPPLAPSPHTEPIRGDAPLSAPPSSPWRRLTPEGVSVQRCGRQ